MVLRLVAVFVACSGLLGVAAQDVDANRIRTRTGPPLIDNHDNWQILSTGAWWVRVNVTTEARSITWRLGKSEPEMTPAGPEPNHGLYWESRGISAALGNRDRRLYPGNMPLWLWEYLQPEETIYAKAKAEPANASASFCVFYQQQGVALIQFRNETEKPVVITRAHHEPLCTP